MRCAASTAHTQGATKAGAHWEIAVQIVPPDDADSAPYQSTPSPRNPSNSNGFPSPTDNSVRNTFWPLPKALQRHRMPPLCSALAYVFADRAGRHGCGQIARGGKHSLARDAARYWGGQAPAERSVRRALAQMELGGFIRRGSTGRGRLASEWVVGDLRRAHRPEGCRVILLSRYRRGFVGGTQRLVGGTQLGPPVEGTHEFVGGTQGPPVGGTQESPLGVRRGDSGVPPSPVYLQGTPLMAEPPAELPETPRPAPGRTSSTTAALTPRVIEGGILRAVAECGCRDFRPAGTLGWVALLPCREHE
jgi:hypothetical protein